MKKTLNRILAAAVAVPVAMSQVLAIGATAAEDVAAPEITTKNLLYIDPETEITEQDGLKVQVSNWNETMNQRFENNNNSEISINAKEIVNLLPGTGYYVSLIKEIVAASANPTATLKDGVITITGDADLSPYVAPKLNDKFAALGYDVTLDTAILQGSYTVTVTTDLANSKEATADVTFTAGGVTYTAGTMSTYFDAINEDLAAQIKAAIEDKQVSGADITGDLEELASVANGFKSKFDTLLKKKDLLTSKVINRSYTSADAAVAGAISFAVKNGIASAANLPTTVNGLVDKYGSSFDGALASLNNDLTAAGVNVKLAISAADVAEVLNGATKVDVDLNAGAYQIDVQIADDATEAAAVEEKVIADELAKDATKAVVNFTTYKVITVTASADTQSASFDVVRVIDYDLEDEKTTTTTTSETTTSDVSETTTTDVTTDTTNGSETTTTTDVTTDTTNGSETTATTNGSETTTTTDVTTDTTNGSETTATTNGSETTDTTNTSDTTGTTGELPPIEDVDHFNIELADEEVSEGVYFSHETAFDAADLIVSAVVVLKDGNEVTLDPAVAFGFLKTPAEVYDETKEAEGEAFKGYFKGGVDIYYVADETKTPVTDADGNAVQPIVAIAMKGDTQLDGDVDLDDGFDAMQYYAFGAAGRTDKTLRGIAGADDDALLEKLAFYVSDIDTESKAGKKTDDATVDLDDGFDEIQYYAFRAVGTTDKTWEDLVDARA